jgi:HEAT repeat protein
VPKRSLAGGKQALEHKVEALAALRDVASAEAGEKLRKALKDRSNYLVSKAAALAGELNLTELIPDLVQGFDRFMIEAVKTDPQCWAKNAIVKTLKDLNHDDPAIFLRGLGHVQMEAVWGGTVDTAITLRGACALALVTCALDRQAILTRLTDLLVDKPTVRIEAIRALGQCPGHDTELLLRLKAMLPEEEAAVTGQCFDALLDMAAAESVPFVAGFLTNPDPDVRSEAVAALAASREPQAVEALKVCFEGRSDNALKTAILQSLAGARQPAAAEFLLTVIAEGRSEHAALAVASAGQSRFRDESRERVEAIVRRRDMATLTEAYRAAFQN